MSRARGNCFASIHRKSADWTLPRAKLQKSQVALQALVTATLHNAGPPCRMSRRTSQVFDIADFKAYLPVRARCGNFRQSPSTCSSRTVPLSDLVRYALSARGRYALFGDSCKAPQRVAER